MLIGNKSLFACVTGNETINETATRSNIFSHWDMALRTLVPTGHAVMVVLFLLLTFSLGGVVHALETKQIPETASTSPSSSSSFSSTSWDVDPTTIRMFEYFVTTIVVGYIVMFVIGKRQNLTLAHNLSKTLTTALSKQFAQFGTQSGKQLTRDGSYFFWYFATGRRYTPGLTISMDLIKRMDIFTYTSAFMTAPEKDVVTLYLPISDDVKMDSMTLFIIKRSELQRIRASSSAANPVLEMKLSQIDSMHTDVISDIPGISADFNILCEHADIVTTLLPDSMRQIISQHTASISSLQVTDQGSKWDMQSSMARRLIRIEFSLPYNSAKHQQLVVDMCRLALHLLDTLATTRISPMARKRVADLRKRAVEERERIEQKARAEEATNRRLEKKKQEEEAVSKMSAEKQRKYEEKRRKKEISSKMRKAIKK